MNSDLQLPTQHSLDICGIVHNTVVGSMLAFQSSAGASSVDLLP